MKYFDGLEITFHVSYMPFFPVLYSVTVIQSFGNTVFNMADSDRQKPPESKRAIKRKAKLEARKQLQVVYNFIRI